MALHADVRKALAIKLEEYEGRIPHLYLDSVGLVTVGVGHQVAHRNDMAALTLMTGGSGTPMRAATLKEKQDEFDTLAKQRKGYRAGWYAQHASLTMRDAEINALLTAHIDGFHAKLAKAYTRQKGYPKDFDGLPHNVQLALFDLIFNLGPTGLTKFTQFDKSIKAGDWKKAAEQCNRSQVSGGRNEYVKKLLLTTGTEA
ncbi:MAG: glycoside hydrolase family protein [Burkholderiales bacterium]|nr:glycoside hydrolase family protein [Burkholderiales bacterium]